MKTALAAILLLIFSISAMAADIVADNFMVKEFKREPGGYVRISMKADVHNPGAARMVYVKFRGQDADGFELHGALFPLTEVGGGETKTLTDTTLIKAEIFERITTWEITHVNAYPPEP